jgi:serine/threonine-protein kinase
LHIVHRDVSPQNIMLSRAGHVQVLDFGAAKAIDHSQHTAAGVLVGKLAYMAPEQVRGDRSSPRTDVFATGVVLWEALVGERLFYDPDLARGELLQSLVLKPIPRPSQLRPELPARLDDVVQMALARNPRRRYQSAQEFAVALEACAEPVGAAALGRFVTEVCAARLADKESLLREGMMRAALEPSGPTPSSEQALVVPARPGGVVLARAHGHVGVRASRWAWAGAAMLTALGIWWLGRLLLPQRADTIARDHLAVAPAAIPAPPPAVYLEPEAAPEDVAPIAVEVTLPPSTPARAVRSLHAPAREARSTVRPPAPVPGEGGTARAAAKDTSCDPPTFMDAAGIRHFKKGCL